MTFEEKIKALLNEETGRIDLAEYDNEANAEFYAFLDVCDDAIEKIRKIATACADTIGD